MINLIYTSTGLIIGSGLSYFLLKNKINSVKTVANQLNTELEEKFKTLQTELEKKTYQSYLLYEINKSINNNLDVEEIATLILQALVTITGAESSTIMIMDEISDEFRIVSYCGIPDIEREMVLFNSYYKKSIAWEVMQSGKAYIEKESHLHKKFRPSTDNYVVSIPINFAKDTIGVINIHNMGSEYDITDTHLDFLYNLAGQAALAIKNSFNLSKLRQQATLLEKQAITDGLTGLYNHIYFQQKLSEEMERGRRYNGMLSLILFDIDHFKHFNDTYGHPFGDLVLKEIASIVSQSIRNIDMAARYGGEEFAVILPHTDGEGAFVVAERIRKNIEEHIFADEEKNLETNVTVSLGISNWNKAQSKSELISQADQALYSAKNSGRNQIKVFGGSAR